MQATNSTGRRTIEVKLSAPIEWHDKTLDLVRVKEPSAGMLFKLGVPQIYVSTPTGDGVSLVDVPPVWMAYIDACVQVEAASAFMDLLPLADGRAIKRAIVGFFREEQAEGTSS